tara:strand:- start:8522 stop:9274 length:753 start_codon:yes stop_codon:yes gene_type:complete
MSVAVFIPSYNCEEQIVRVLEQIKQTDLPIYFIDNSSKDSGAMLIRDFCHERPKCKLILHSENYGLGGSFKTAIEIANKYNHDWIIWFHGDDQATLKDCLPLVDGLSSLPQVDAYLGARFMPSSRRLNYSRLREFGNRFFNLLCSLVVRRRVYDIGSGLNIYRTSSLNRLRVEEWPNHIAFDMNLLFHYVSSSRHLFFPISWREVDQVSNAKNFAVGVDVLKSIIVWIMRKELIFESSDDPSKRVYSVEP